MAESGDQLAGLAGAVARHLFGEENRQLSKPDELRFGKQGSRSVNIKTGQFFDHQENQGGGVLWAVETYANAPVKGGHAVEYLRQNGFDIDDNRPQPRQERSPGGARRDEAGNYLPGAVGDGGKLTATYDYRDRNGDLIYQVCRYDWPDPQNPKGHSKTFIQRRPDKSKKDGWNYKMRDSGITHLPYRAQELADDVANGELIFLVEGEKKVDMLRDLGVAATCNHGGAGKFSVDLVDWFGHAQVVILPDNDRAGREHANLVGGRIKDVARSVRILDLPDLPEKGGVDDWLPMGGTVEKLFSLVKNKAVQYRPQPPKSLFSAVPWQRIADAGPGLEWLVKGWLAENEVSLLAGPSQSGKSFLAIDLAMSVARGVDWHGAKVRGGGVLYQAGESAVGVRRRRLPAYAVRNGLAYDDQTPFILLPKQVDLFDGDEATDALVQEAAAWSAYLDDPIKLIVIDTLSRATTGANENDGRDMGIVLERCERIRRETKAHVLLVHHMNASGTKARGHTSLMANVDSQIIVQKIEDTFDGDRRQLREAKLAKLKDGEDSKRFEFVLPSVEIGIDEDGDPITSCVVTKPNSDGIADPKQSAGLNIQGNNAAVLRVIYQLIEQHGEPAPPELNLPDGTKVGSRKQLGKMLVAALSPDNPDDVARNAGETIEDARERAANARRQQGFRSRQALFSKAVIGISDDWVWLTGRRVRGFGKPPGQAGYEAAKSAADAAARAGEQVDQVDLEDFWA